MQTLNFNLISINNMDDENLPVQCHPIPKPKKKKQENPKYDSV